MGLCRLPYNHHGDHDVSGVTGVRSRLPPRQFGAPGDGTDRNRSGSHTMHWQHGELQKARKAKGAARGRERWRYLRDRIRKLLREEEGVPHLNNEEYKEFADTTYETYHPAFIKFFQRGFLRCNGPVGAPGQCPHVDQCAWKPSDGSAGTILHLDHQPSVASIVAEIRLHCSLQGAERLTSWDLHKVRWMHQLFGICSHDGMPPCLSLRCGGGNGHTCHPEILWNTSSNAPAG